MCKARFGSQGVILDGFKQRMETTLMELEIPRHPTFKENSIKNLDFVCFEYFP